MQTARIPTIVGRWRLILTLVVLLWPGVATAASSMVDQLVAAAKSDDLALIKDLLDKGADVNATGQSGRTALMEAALFNKMGAAKLLIVRGADVTVRGKGGMTPLACATVPNKFTQTEQGAAKNLKVHGVTPAFVMLYVPRDVEMASFLIEAGAAVNAQDGSGETPLIGALRCNSPALVKLLLSKGCDVNIGYENGDTPLMRAVRGDYGDVSSLVAGKKGGSFTEMVELLIGHGADVNAKTKEGVTALMEAAHMGSLKVTRLLLEKGADVNSKDQYDRTALKWAAIGRHTKIVELLKAHGAKE